MRQRFCIKCGEKIIEGALFCAYCGAKLLVPEVEEPVVTAMPEPEPIPEPVIEEPAVAAEPEPEAAPEPVIEEPAFVAEPEPMPEPELVIEEPVVMEEPEPEPVLEPVIEEPAFIAEPEPIPEPVIEEPAFVAEPEPIPEPAAAARPTPEPVPVIIEPAAEPEPQPAEAAPEGEVHFDNNIDKKVDINDNMFDMYNGQNEGTVFLVGQHGAHPGTVKEKNGIFYLSDSEMQKGVVRIVDFGTGERFEITIPAGVREGDCLLITDTGLRDHATGSVCNIRLRVVRI